MSIMLHNHYAIVVRSVLVRCSMIASDSRNHVNYVHAHMTGGTVGSLCDLCTYDGRDCNLVRDTP